MPTGEPNLLLRVQEAAEQLERYGEVADTRLVDVLDLLADINDDMVNGRKSQFVHDYVNRACRMLQDVDRDYAAVER